MFKGTVGREKFLNWDWGGIEYVPRMCRICILNLYVFPLICYEFLKVSAIVKLKSSQATVRALIWVPNSVNLCPLSAKVSYEEKKSAKNYFPDVVLVRELISIQTFTTRQGQFPNVVIWLTNNSVFMRPCQVRKQISFRIWGSRKLKIQGVGVRLLYISEILVVGTQISTRTVA